MAGTAAQGVSQIFCGRGLQCLNACTGGTVKILNFFEELG